MQLSKPTNVARLRPSRRANVRAQAAAVELQQTKHKLKAADRVKLGNSDLEVSACCLGTMTWGSQNTEAEAHQQMSYAWDMGINFMDTAEMYPAPVSAETQGNTDRCIASWLKTGRVKREDVVLASKVVGRSDRVPWIRAQGGQTRVDRANIMESVEGSLKRLQTDYIDLLQIHWPDRNVGGFGAVYDPAREWESVPIEEQLRALQELVEAGKVRYVGLSNETSYGVMEFLRLAEQAGLPRVQSVQNCYHMLARLPVEIDLTETLLRRSVSLLAFSPLAGGVLSGKYTRPGASSDPSLQRSRHVKLPDFQPRYMQPMVQEAVRRYDEIAQKYGMSLAEMAMAWVKSRPVVASTIIGATTMDQLKENLRAFDKELSPECMAEIAAVFKQYRDPALVV
ncbi:hypothetical protein HYH03_012917 [Edaphochlamys debaryana]|uniref:NADP-dependent oxidoreductase domain-containing protein n=1 Tax=Edaphochlamys debaryana TaxID=47281 RepID=A0A835XQW7_9CHLO|nr:hypothetical protein HYH03_012917 [Edaphochlamys debaryana]|eukprot:KAG2488598.1 hypothetical protein HYH03_012917 [Edaphochlamys debaryana]